MEPEQLIQRPGAANAIRLADTGFKDLEEASDIGGFSPVSKDTQVLPEGNGRSGVENFTVNNLANGDGNADDIDLGEEDDISFSDTFSTREDFDTRVAAERERLETSGETARSAAEAKIAAQFEPFIEDAEKFKVDIGESTRGEFGTNRRLSTAALSFVDTRVAAAQEKITELEDKRDAAIASLDTTLAESIEADIKTFRTNELFWIQRQDDLAKQKFDQDLAIDKLGISKDTASLAQARETRLANSDLRTKTLDNISKIAESNITLDQISAEERDKFETSAGLPQGSFEAIFNNLQEAKQAEQFGDEVKLHQSLSTLLDSVAEGTELVIGDNVYKGSKGPDVNIITKEDTNGNVLSIGLDKDTGEEIYRTSLGHIGKGFKTSTAGSGFTLASGAKNKMIAAGVSLDDINALQTNIKNGHSLDDIFNAEGTEISTEQQTVIRNAMSGVTPTVGDFDNLTDDQFSTAYLSPFASKSGKVDGKEFLKKSNADTILEADRRGFFDDDETGFVETQLDRIKFGFAVFTGDQAEKERLRNKNK